MPLYKVLTRILGRNPEGEDKPGDLVVIAADEAQDLLALGALELLAVEPGEIDDDSDPDEGADEILAVLDTLTVKQLKSLADAAKLDLGTATKKGEIVLLLADSVDRTDVDQIAAFIVMAETAKAS